MRFWIFLISSSALQVGWLISLRETHGMTRIAPFALNAVFGLTSTILLSKSLEGIPMSAAYAAWTGLSIVGSVLTELPARPAGGLPKIVCILLILAGTTGLKLAGVGPKPVTKVSGLAEKEYPSPRWPPAEKCTSDPISAGVKIQPNSIPRPIAP